MHNLVEIPPSKVLLAGAKVIFILPLWQLELEKISLEVDPFNSFSGHFKLDEAVLDLLHHFTIEGRVPSTCSVSPPGLKVGLVRLDSPSSSRELGNSMFYHGEIYGGS